MKRSRAVAVTLIIVVAVIGAAVGVSRAAASADRVVAAVKARAELAARDQDIVFYQKRVARDPIGAADRARLAALYLQRARETGDFEDYRRAEDLARRSLALRVTHNSYTYAILTAALLAQHRFTEALAAASALDAQ